MDMRKKPSTLVFLPILAIVLLLSACDSNQRKENTTHSADNSTTQIQSQDGKADYRVYEQNGEWYFEVTSGVDSFRDSYKEDVSNYAFESIGGLYTATVSGDLPEAALCNLHICDRSETRFPICAPDELLNVLPPKKVEIVGIRWEAVYEIRYIYGFQRAEGTGEIFTDTADKFLKEYCTKQETYPHDKREKLEEWNAEAFWLYDSTATWGDDLTISYIVNTAKGETYIVERYEGLKSRLTASEVRKTCIPKLITFYREDAVFPLQGEFYPKEIMESYAWLGEFDIQKYVPVV